jgi:hypothetical protein
MLRVSGFKVQDDHGDRDNDRGRFEYHSPATVGKFADDQPPGQQVFTTPQIVKDRQRR